MDWKETLTHPLTGIVGVFAYLAGLIDPVIMLVGQTSGLWFPLVGVFDQLARSVAWIPASLTESVVVIALVIYAIYLSDSLIERVTNFIKR